MSHQWAAVTRCLIIIFTVGGLNMTDILGAIIFVGAFVITVFWYKRIKQRGNQ